MKLTPNKIPLEFKKSIPGGMRLIKKENNEFLLVESIFCPNGHNLLDDSIHIHHEASIKLKIMINKIDGFLFIDPFWGSHSKLFSFLPPMTKPSTYVQAFCPYCNVEISGNYSCAEDGCDSENSLALLLPGGKNRIDVCSKLGCPGHSLSINELSHGLVETVNDINFFGAGSDDIFGGI